MAYERDMKNLGLTIFLFLAACGDDSSTGDGGSGLDGAVDSSARDGFVDMNADASFDAGSPSPSDASLDSSSDAGVDAGEPECTYPTTTTWSGEEPQPDLSVPAPLESYTDPTFGTSVTRITDGLHQHYSKTQPWNSDGSVIFTARGGHALLDGSTYAVLDKPNAPTGERRWSTTNPDQMFHIDGARFLAYSLASDESSLLHDFEDEGCDLVRLGPWEGNLSIGDERVAFACQMGSDLEVILYEIETDTIIGSRTFSGRWGDDQLDWVSVSQSGEYVVISWNDSVESFRANAAIDDVVSLTDEGQHGDLCVDAAGNEVMVQVICGGHTDRDVAGVMSYDLETGEKTVLIPSDNFVCVGHISCRNFRRPGWAYVSSGHHSEAFAVRLDGSHDVQRFAHTHQSYSQPDTSGFESLAVPSPNGCSVMFGSDWHASASASAYVAARE